MQQADAVLLANQLTDADRRDNGADAWQYEARLVNNGTTYAVAVIDWDGYLLGLLPSNL